MGMLTAARSAAREENTMINNRERWIIGAVGALTLAGPPR
jgi:hypothetical protein